MDKAATGRMPWTSLSPSVTADASIPMGTLSPIGSTFSHTANTISSTYATLAEKYGAEVKGVDDLNQTIELLLSNRIDATLNTEVTYYDYLKAHPDANIKIAALSDEVEKVAIPVRKGDDTKTLLAAINDALAKLDESGELTALSEKYFGTDISKLEN